MQNMCKVSLVMGHTLGDGAGVGRCGVKDYAQVSASGVQ